MTSAGKFVSINAALSRSVNLERDQSARAMLDAYILTSRALQTISQVADVCAGKNDSDKAWALIGSYGSGKSSFALYLSHLLANPRSANGKQALAKLQGTDAGDANHCAAALKNHLKGSAGYCPVLLSGYPEHFAKAFLRGLSAAIQPYFAGELRIDSSGEVGAINRLLKSKAVSLPATLKLIRQIQQRIESAGGKGLLIVIDELGKFLEYAGRHESNDIFLLQMLAEQAHTTGKSNMLLFVLLHQSFEQYGRALSASLRNEWTKIQGRYQTLPFVETTEQSMHIIARVFENRLPKSHRAQLKTRIAGMVESMAKAGILPAAMAKETAVNLFLQCYPLHPMALLLLPRLCQKVAQNERSLFHYLGGADPCGFGEQMQGVTVGDFLRPAAVHDYFISTRPASNDLQTQRAWVEVLAAIDRMSEAGQVEVDLLKTIGLFNIAGSAGGMKASLPALELCFDGVRGFTAALRNLQKTSAVTFRRFNNEYRVWQGSDFDLEQAIAEQHAFAQTTDIAAEINTARPFLPFVAKRYSIEKHSMFYFVPKFINASQYKSEAPESDKPRIIFCLSDGNHSSEKKYFRGSIAPHFSARDIVVHCANSGEIKSFCRARIAVQKAGEDPAVSNDPVIRREFNLAFAAAQQNERDELKNIIEQPKQHLWYCNGEQHDPKSKRDMQALLSTVLERVYPETPVIKNELINRDQPSAQAIAGRKQLLLGLLQNSNKERFGIKGYPAEMSMYLAIFKESGMHIQKNAGWELAKPSKTDESKFHAVWCEIEKFFCSAEQHSKNTAMLENILAAPPFGVKNAVFPVFFLAVYLHRQNEIAVYENRIYVPYFTVQHLERFLKRPHNFSFQQFKIAGAAKKLLQEYEHVLFGGQKSESVLALFRPLATFMEQLPEYTKQTKSMSESAQKVRDVFKHPKSPQDLLFAQLPEACGCKKGAAKHSFGKALKAALQEVKNAYPEMLNKQVAALNNLFDLELTGGIAALRVKSQSICKQLREYTADTNVLAFIDSITADFGDDARWLERVLALVAGKPTRGWDDHDAVYAAHKITAYKEHLTVLVKMRLYSTLHSNSGEAVLCSVKSTSREESKIVYIKNSMSQSEQEEALNAAMLEISRKFRGKPQSTPEKKTVLRLIKSGKSAP